MAGKDETEGLAERSLNTSVAPPGRNSPGQPEDGGRSPAGNDQREGLEKTSPDRPDAETPSKP